MGGRRFDALVVGSGPAGSVAALVLARAGASVALVDRAPFPRDKACGDLIGPRGVRVLDDLGIDTAAARRVEDMVVVGPTGRRVRLPCYGGTTYPGYALALPRWRLDAILHDAAVAAGAAPIVARVRSPHHRSDGVLDGFALSTGGDVRADVVVGADGATSHVANVAGLVDGPRLLLGFALRAYVVDEVASPHLVLWEEAPRRGFPGYGWVFPGADGRVNLGLGLGVLADRRAGAAAVRAFGAFTDHLRRVGVLTGPRAPVPPTLGGWLKMGMVGTAPARGRVVLVGDAAGLVNPLQGEGISQAMGSGRAAAEAILADPGRPGPGYRAFLRTTYAPYHAITAPIHRSLLPRPLVVASVERLLTAPGVGRVAAGAWSICWNDLLVGAAPRPARTLAAVATALGRRATSRGPTRRWFDELADETGETDGTPLVPPPR